MSNFNERTALNYQLRQDKLSNECRRRKARQRIEYRRRIAAARHAVQTAVLDVALIGAMVLAFVALVTCMVC